MSVAKEFYVVCHPQATGEMLYCLNWDYSKILLVSEDFMKAIGFPIRRLKRLAPDAGVVVTITCKEATNDR